MEGAYPKDKGIQRSQGTAHHPFGDILPVKQLTRNGYIYIYIYISANIYASHNDSFENKQARGNISNDSILAGIDSVLLRGQPSYRR